MKSKAPYIIFILNIPLVAIALFAYFVYKKIEARGDPELFLKLKMVHSERIKTENPELLRDHAKKLWECLETTEEGRIDYLTQIQRLSRIVIYLILLQILLLILYYFIKRIKTKKANKITSANGVP